MNTIWQFARFCVRIAVVRSFVRLRRTALLWHVVVCMPILNQSSTAGNVAWERKGTERCRRFASWIANAGTSSRYRRRLQVASESFWTWRLFVPNTHSLVGNGVPCHTDRRHFVDHLLYLTACVFLWMQMLCCDCMWYSLDCEFCTRPDSCFLTTSEQVYYCVFYHTYCFC